MPIKHFALGSIIALIGLNACTSADNGPLPILGHRTTVSKIVDGKILTDTNFQTIENFRFVNQDSQWVSNETFKDKIYVADFFFTSCPTICPIMKKNMLTIYNKYKGNASVGILSHSIDPRRDSVAVLKKFADKIGLEGTQWNFVTGNRDSIYALAAHSYLTFAASDSTAPGGIIHQGFFMLIDKNRHIRGAYDGTNTESVKQLAVDMDKLLKE